ncbi:MAG: tetratricopeptide repeat protein [Chthoniobacterales bacterium]|nr:tetratricopeptide repeat protein [Chthoniobacterales bacterium]
MGPTFSPSHPQPDRTFAIAIAAVALFGAAQLIAIGAHYAGKARSARAASHAPVTSAQPAVQTQPDAATPAGSAPAQPATAAASPAQAAPSTEAVSAAERLLKEATLLRERGDTTNALARLQDASQREPGNANVLAEMAMIYESIQQLDRSNETWRKIQQIGPAAGALYELADIKLRVGAQPTAPSSVAVSEPGFAGVSPLDAGTNRNGPDGIPDGSTFGITDAAVTNNPDPDAETNLTLRVGVKVRPNTLIDHTKVKIQVYFYDTVDNNKVALTDAEVSYEWLTPNHDWKGANPEILAVTYVRLKGGAISTETALSEAAAAVTPPPAGKKAATPKKPAGDSATRKYAGYQVRVYYNDQLQDVRAEPTKLLNLFAPPLTLTSQ